MNNFKCSMNKKKESLTKKSEGLSEYRHYTNPDNGRTASLDPIKHPGLNKFIVYFGTGEKRYSSIKDAEDDLKSRGYEKDESKKSEAYSDYDTIRDWLEGVMEKAGTMFESAYVSENGPGEICAEIEGYDSTGGDAIISLVWNAGEDFAETISAMADELVEYAEDFDPDEEAETYRNSGMAGVPSLRQLLKAMDERKEDMVSLAGEVSLAASKL